MLIAICAFAFCLEVMGALHYMLEDNIQLCLFVCGLVGLTFYWLYTAIRDDWHREDP